MHTAALLLSSGASKPKTVSFEKPTRQHQTIMSLNICQSDFETCLRYVIPPDTVGISGILDHNAGSY